MSERGRARRAIVLQHDDHVKLGNFGPVLVEHGFDIRTVDAALDVPGLDPVDGDLVIVLGGEMGAYETEEFPHLVDELTFIRARIDAEKPIFGVCLGAQLMAGALGAENYKGERPDLGYRQLELTGAGRNSPIRHVEGVGMLEWHGDHYTFPEGATLLATSPAYANEAFGVGDFGLAIQFHPEVTDEMHEEWTVRSEDLFARERVDSEEWRALGRLHNPPMQVASRAMFGEWLDRTVA